MIRGILGIPYSLVIGSLFSRDLKEFFWGLSMILAPWNVDGPKVNGINFQIDYQIIDRTFFKFNQPSFKTPNRYPNPNL